MSAAANAMRVKLVLRQLVDAASDRYRAAGRSAYFFARGKLANDPVFEAVLAQGLLTGRRVLDLGCGQGLLAAWSLAAQSLAAGGVWPQHWPAPPSTQDWRGIERERRYVRRARLALGAAAEFVEGDVRTADFGCADTIVLLDVLHYIEYAEQQFLLERVRHALAANGVLLVRVGNASGGWGFVLAKRVDEMVMLASGRGLRRLNCRTTADWLELLDGAGFTGTAVPMSMGTPFANELIAAHQR